MALFVPLNPNLTPPGGPIYLHFAFAGVIPFIFAAISDKRPNHSAC